MYGRQEIELTENKISRPNRKSYLRLTGYDYSRTNYYYVTICTQNRIDWFGKIIDGKMVLNGAGKIVDEKWQWLIDQYHYIVPDEYIVMPDHFHGILVIDNPNDKNGMQFEYGGEMKRDRSRPVPTKGNDTSNDNGIVKIKSLSSLIGAFKTTSSKYIRNAGFADFAWQRSFYDRIVRSDDELEHVRKYIQNNPQQKSDNDSGFETM